MLTERSIARPRTLPEAVEARSRIPHADVLAGGTDFMVDVNAGRHRPRGVIALRRVDEMRSVSVGAHVVEVGALTTYRTMDAGPIAEHFPALNAAARTIGSPAIRNAGTIGGNLATASPAGDTLPFLLAVDADVLLTSLRGDRVEPIGHFVAGPKRTTLAADELIRAVRLPRVHGPQHFLKIGSRNAMVISVASCALIVDTDGQRIRIGLGSVGPRPLRASAAEEFLTAEMDWNGLRMSADAIRNGARLAAEAAAPITDHRGSADYRRHSVRVMVERALRRSVTA